MKNTLNTDHPPRREALRLHRYEDPPDSPGLQILIFVEDSWNKEPCRDVHQRMVSYQKKVIPSLMMLVQDTFYRKSPSPAFGGAACSVCSAVQKVWHGRAVWHDRVVWHDRAVWHEPEQFSSELNNISLTSVQRSVQVRYTLTCLASTLKIGVTCSLDSPPQRMNIKDVVRELQHVMDMLQSGASRRGFNRHDWKLWKDLEIQKIITNGVPWIILGDFNVTFKVSEHSNGGAYPTSDMTEFQDCINNIKFSINVNGERVGYFKGGRGLRQGDPISPYLFTLVMEVLNLLIKKNIEESKVFKYHFGCKNLKITHLYFADDLLVFCHGDSESVKVSEHSNGGAYPTSDMTEFQDCINNIKNSSNAITTVLPTKEPEYSLSMREEHLSTIPKTKSDEVIKSSVKNLVPIPSVYEDFSGELMPTSIINEERIKREHEEYISLMKKLLTINSFPRPLENFHANTIIETLPTSLIPVEDSDSLREEIDIFTSTDDFMPPGIESDDYDLEGDIHFLEELLSNDSISLPENESSNFEIFFKPDSGVLTTNVVKPA
nr:RNA-directed DNA polymerase, eukaryota, reverse transcriptase zinc-binding domain protein [Tanacetum cinerariifolium]GEX89519.1 RNA-directed DNA polymerase, eukaryota, reverse transcriptase zinc-binding domain protein [Tanacetum cinerariifolium]